MRFYLAGPFFNDEQRKTMEQIEQRAVSLGIDFYSPRLSNFCPPNAPMERRQKAFINNIDNLERDKCDFVLARIDDFDPGTMWEIGYAFCAVQRIYAFTTVPGRGLNLMLAQSVDGFLQTLPEVFEFLREAKEGDFGRAIKWKNEII